MPVNLGTPSVQAISHGPPAGQGCFLPGASMAASDTGIRNSFNREDGTGPRGLRTVSRAQRRKGEDRERSCDRVPRAARVQAGDPARAALAGARRPADHPRSQIVRVKRGKRDRAGARERGGPVLFLVYICNDCPGRETMIKSLTPAPNTTAPPAGARSSPPPPASPVGSRICSGCVSPSRESWRGHLRAASSRWSRSSSLE